LHDLHVLSWNPDKISHNDSETFVRDLLRRYHIVCVQESGSLNMQDGLICGHTVVGDCADARSPSVIVHRSLATHIVATSCGMWHSMVALVWHGRHHIFASVYLPHSGHADEVFESALLECDTALAKLARVNSVLVASGDFNVELPPVEGITGDLCTGLYLGARGSLLVSFAAKWNLSWHSTFRESRKNDAPAWTWAGKDGHARKAMIDYVCSSCACFGFETLYNIDYNSDHRPISFTVPGPSPAKKRKHFFMQPRHVDWKSEETVQYVHSAFAALDLVRDMPDISACHKVLQCIKENVPPTSRAKHTMPLVLQNRYAALDSCEDPGEKLVAAKQLYREKRAWLDSVRTAEFPKKIAKQYFNKKAKPLALQKFRCNGTLSEDRTAWSEEISNGYAALYKDSSVINGVIDPARRAELLALQRSRLEAIRCRAQGEPPLSLPLWCLLEARARFSARSTAPGHDSICWGYLAALPIDVVVRFQSCFERRLNDLRSHSTIPEWTKIIVRLIPKDGSLQDLANWRPISLSTTIEKWFQSCAVCLMDSLASPLSEGAIGFHKNHQSMEISEGLRGILQKCRQWSLPCTIAKADIRKAFDHMDHDVLVECLRFHSVPEKLTHAVIASLVGNEAHLFLGDVQASCPVLLASGGKQGASETPALWNRLLDVAWQRSISIWEREHLGFVLDTPCSHRDRVFGAFWADDLYLVSSSSDHVARMFSILSSEIAALKLSWKPSALEVLCNHTDDIVTEFVWPSCFGPCTFKRVAKLGVLGTVLDSSGSTSTSIRARMSVVYGKWATLRPYFVSRRVPLVARVRKWYETLGRCFLFGAGGWTMTDEHIRMIDRFEKGFLRHMLCRARGPDESYIAYDQRVNAKIAELTQRVGLMPLSLQCLCAYYGWAGHIARIKPGFLAKVFAWRDISWYKRLQHTGKDDIGMQLPKMTVGRPTRWDEAIFDTEGITWRESCLDRAPWARRKVELAQQRWALVVSAARAFRTRASTQLAHISGRLAASCGRKFGTRAHLLVAVDSAQVAHQVSGTWACDDEDVSRGRWELHALFAATGLSTWPNFHLQIVHRKRQHNSAADSAAELARVGGSFLRALKWNTECGDRFLLTCDGSYGEFDGKPAASVGICLFVYRGDGIANLVLYSGVRVNPVSSVHSEFEAFHVACHVVGRWFEACCSG
jgi:Reverse transcriptase (RNA-dependent DNA polymerase)